MRAFRAPGVGCEKGGPRAALFLVRRPVAQGPRGCGGAFGASGVAGGVVGAVAADGAGAAGGGAWGRTTAVPLSSALVNTATR